MLYSVFSPALDMLHLTPDLWHVISDTDTLHVILDTWYLTPTLDMLYLTHQHLICYTWHLIHDTWYLHRFLTCHTWYLILTPNIWHMLTLTWHAFIWYKHIDLILWCLTEYYYPWCLYYIAYSWLSLLWGLSKIIIMLPDIWYSWIPVLLNSCILEPLKQGDSWHYAPDIILMLIPVIG